MTAFSVYRSGRGVRRRDKKLGAHPKMLLVTERGLVFVAPWAPRETDTTGLAPVFDAVERDGRKPLLLFSSQPLEQHQFDIGFGHLNGDPIDHDLQRLTDVAKTLERLRIVFDGRLFDGRLWRITSLSVQITQRQHGTNRPTQGTATLTVT